MRLLPVMHMLDIRQFLLRDTALWVGTQIRGLGGTVHSRRHAPDGRNRVLTRHWQLLGMARRAWVEQQGGSGSWRGGGEAQAAETKSGGHVVWSWRRFLWDGGEIVLATGEELSRRRNRAHETQCATF